MIVRSQVYELSILISKSNEIVDWDHDAHSYWLDELRITIYPMNVWNENLIWLLLGIDAHVNG